MKPVLLVMLGAMLTLVLQRVIPAQLPYRIVVIVALVAVLALIYFVIADKAFDAYREVLRDE